MRICFFARRWTRAGGGWLSALVLCLAPGFAGAQAPSAAALELTAEERAWLSAHPTIRVGAEINYAPYEFRDNRGHFIGVAADYLELLKQRLRSVVVKVEQLPDFASIEDRLRTRDLDLVLALTPTSEREAFLEFTEPYLNYVNVVVTRDDFGFVTGLRDFEHQSIAVVAGHSSQQLVSRAYPSYRVTPYSDLFDALMAVSTGKQAGLVDDIFPIVYNIRHHQIGNLKIATPIERALQPKGFSIAVRSDWPQLAGILDKALLTITQEEHWALSQKWLSLRYENKVDYRPVWTAAAVSILIMLAAFWWIRMLNQQRRALVAARAAAEAADRAKDQFLASMSHELRTPLHAILGYADLLRSDGLGAGARRDALTTIAASGRQLLELINELLELSRIRAGHLKLNPGPTQLRALLEEIAAMVRVDAHARGLDFSLRLTGELPEVVSADDRRLRQILLNLLSNAIKFTASGRVTLEVEPVASGPDQATLRFSVEDTGPGVAAADKERIFAPFEQGAHGERSESGVGLGLAISQEFAALMGSRIEATAGPAGGSRFHFTATLPVIHADHGPVRASRSIVGYDGPKRTILVVDDQQENRVLLRQMLEPVGFDVAVAGNCEQALDIARERRPALIVMDLRMPGVDGFEATRALRSLPGLDSVPVIAASASMADLARAGADAATFHACLSKPFQRQELLDAIAHALDLGWHLARSDGRSAADAPAEQQLELPAREVLEELLDHARLGKLIRIEQIAENLRGDARLKPFADRLGRMSRDVDDAQLIALLQDALETDRDAVSH